MREISRGHLRLVVSNREVVESAIVIKPRFTDREIEELSRSAGALSGGEYGLGAQGDSELGVILYAAGALLETSGMDVMKFCKDFIVSGIARIGEEYPKLFGELELSRFLRDVNELLLAFDPEGAPIDRAEVEAKFKARCGDEGE